jgi:hypothetical protein
MIAGSLLALVCLIVGLVFAIINGEYRNGTFWLLLAILFVTGLPQALGHL